VGPVRAVVILETLPHSQLLIKVHVIAICEQRVELVLVSSVRAFDLAVELLKRRNAAPRGRGGARSAHDSGSGIHVQ
jgi:hypothetical protein